VIWARRLLVATPFAIAAVLNVLVVTADRIHLHREHIAGYGFLFATPWAWLIDHPGLISNVHNRWLMALFGYAMILWVPAVLYSGCLWLILWCIGIGKSRHPN
jgi:hypothetical protein